jgi:hypothetical protein
MSIDTVPSEAAGICIEATSVTRQRICDQCVRFVCEIDVRMVHFQFASD